MNLYFEKVTIGLHVLYVHNMHVNRMLFTIQSINSYFMHYFKLQKLEFKQLIDHDMIIDFLLSLICKYGEYTKIM